MDFTAKPDSGKERASVPEVQHGAQRVGKGRRCCAVPLDRKVRERREAGNGI